MKYKKKPIEVEAIQWNPKDDFIGEFFDIVDFFEAPLKLTNSGLVIETLEGDMKVLEGSYIVKGPFGEFWSVRNDIFEATYEKVESNE